MGTQVSRGVLGLECRSRGAGPRDGRVANQRVRKALQWWLTRGDLPPGPCRALKSPVEGEYYVSNKG